MSQLDDFIELFDGNRTAVGTENGGSLKVYGEPWATYIESHLAWGGSHAIGVYPLLSVFADDGLPIEWLVKWGCVDFDEGEEESWAHACNVRNILAQFNVTAWVERSRSKGYHVWVFASEWEPAWMVRRGLLMACQLVGAPTKEINPKSEGFPDPDTLGNYVRLPYPGPLSSQVDSTRRVVVDSEGNAWSLDEFLALAMADRGLDGLRDLADAWSPPKPRVERNTVELDEGELADAISRVGIRTKHVLMDGPGDSGRDRSGTLFWLAQLLVRDGNHTYDECVALLAWCDERTMQKYTGRHDAEDQYAKCVDKAWEEDDG